MADTGTTRDRVGGSVTTERDKAFMAKARLLNTPDAPAIDAYLKRLDEELGRRKITIQDPELS